MQIQRPFSQLDWLSTPEAVRQYIVQLENAILQLQQQLDQLEKRTEKLETQTKKNSQPIPAALIKNPSVQKKCR
jgi:cell division protein FtsB